MNFRNFVRNRFVCSALFSFAVGPACAQMPQMPPMLESTRPDLKGEVRLYPGTAPGSATNALPEQWNTMGGFHMARNVTVPTLIPVLPDPAKATGAAVLIAPGGAYMALAMDNEGLLVAHALADRGVAAFVLKYRLDPTPRDIPGFDKAIGERMGPALQAGSKGFVVDSPLAVDDAATALRLIRSRAAEWKIDPARTGMIGFSAGAQTALALTLQNRPGARPDFVAILYGPMAAVRVPPNPAALFVALASNDPLAGRQGFGLVQSWQAAGGAVELHFYHDGDHGFGMRTLGTTSDLWFQEFFAWLKDGKFLSSLENVTR
jgi:acetyl esterase/lipase